MIKLINSLPANFKVADRAENLKLKVVFDVYGDIALFWQQTETGALISMLDNDMIICGNAEKTELSSFIDMLSPKSIFLSEENLEGLDLKITQKALVLKRECDIPPMPCPDELSSAKVYELLGNEDFSLPPYPDFAVDFCRKKNLGCLKVFAKSDSHIALSVSADDFCLINGIKSLKKGMGSIALEGILSQNCGKTALALSSESNAPFYLKNNFNFLYNAYYCERLTIKSQV